MSFSAGLLVALVIAYCYIRQLKGQYSPRDPQQPTPTQASSNIELKDNIIEYGSTLYVGMTRKKNGGPIKRVQNRMFRTLPWM